ncbi:hypothetical protein EV659_108154 [Rhodothalassium salexigens DSM 2132]|uniref:Uncharacterized protein n=1 Tax=Rhodothalassium salexigens DSM 2132 TaxID=1188247 RepID=A0A4R2PCY3_RHOSA|nr:hypothetical protein [Rhodothalassium salexigens]MBB4212179.1 hypothetical protein [Rhodothalassium salexigens DSM 2132]MBK1639977.1 hypothetical protein [Rhodothalassium salexigens DSM 2132]TCP33053.1 hypothetical protein EV659_108154 [Rhodothalassium salexigens DSM 2132]
MEKADNTDQSKTSALDAFEASLAELRAPAKAVIAQALRELFELARKEADAARALADQHKAELSAAFHAYLTLHEDTETFARLKADHEQLLRRTSERGGDHG